MNAGEYESRPLVPEKILEKKSLPATLFFSAAEAQAGMKKKRRDSGVDEGKTSLANMMKRSLSLNEAPEQVREFLCGFDIATCPQGVKLSEKGSIEVFRLKLDHVAREDPVSAFARCLLEEPSDLGEEELDPNAKWPIYGTPWTYLLRLLGKGLKMKHLGPVMVQVRAEHPTPDFTMPFIDDGNTRIEIAFVGSYAYWFCLYH
eukprot:g7348.t1